MAPTGPLNGRPDSWVDSDAALIATTSYGCCGSSARIVSTTWTSLRRPLTKVGRSGRSIRRQVRTASSVGRPSRRKNEPGIRPIEYIRSSTSTVRGKKSNCSFGVLPAVVADRTTVSPSWAITDPAACLASRPVENVTRRVPNRPLSMVAVLCWVPRVCSVMGKLCSFGRGYDLGELPGGRSSIEACGTREGSEGHYRGPVRSRRCRAPLSMRCGTRMGCCAEGRLFGRPSGSCYRRKPSRSMSER